MNDEIIRGLFSKIEWSERGQCHFAEMRISDDSVISFLASSSNAEDLSMVAQGIEALVRVGSDYDDYRLRVCVAAEDEIAPYLDSIPESLEVLAAGLSLIYIETMAGKTITTLEDTTGIIGGHVLNVHLDSNWHITSVKLEDQ